LKKVNPEAAEALMSDANKVTSDRYDMHKKLAAMQFGEDE